MLSALTACASTRRQSGSCCRCCGAGDGGRPNAEQRAAGTTAAQLCTLLDWRLLAATALTLVAAAMGHTRYLATEAPQSRCGEMTASASPRRMPREAAAAPQIRPAATRSLRGMTAVRSSIGLHHEIERHCTTAERSDARAAFATVPSKQTSSAERGYRASCSWKRWECLQEQQ